VDGEAIDMTSPLPTHLETPARRKVRVTAGAVAGALTLVYLWMFFAVRAAEAGADENTFGAYLQLAAVYGLGTVLLLALDRPWVWVVGLVVQVVVASLFLVFGTAILDYDLVSGQPLWLWIILTSLGQAALLGLLGYLLASTRTPRRPD
jgi:hypothetical protein